jgi:hypothetical protein
VRAMDSAASGMESLAPRSAYDEDELGITRRMPLYAGTFYGVGMALAGLISGMFEGDSLATSLIKAVFAGVVGGAAFGFLLPWMLRRLGKRVNDRIYAGDPGLVPVPEPGYAYRLPCGWMRTPKLAVGGVLYLGRRGLRFDPHLRNRNRQHVVMEPLEQLELAMVQVPLPAFFRLWGVRTAPRVEVRCGAQVQQFTVPTTSATFARLRESVDLLRR